MIGFLQTTWKKVVAIGVGRITSDPIYNTVGRNDDPLCKFFVQSDQRGKGAEKEYESYVVNVWKDNAGYASNFEKGDFVFLCGECKVDDFYTKRHGKTEYLINADFVIPANIGAIVMQLQQVINLLNSQGAEQPQNAASDQNGFTDYSSMEIPPEFQDLEPDI